MSDIHYDIRDHFRRHDLDRFVDAYVLSFEHGIQKPDAEMFTRALDALDVTADRALMVGDTPSHDGAAADVGIPTFILPGPFRAGRDRPARPRRGAAARPVIALARHASRQTIAASHGSRCSAPSTRSSSRARIVEMRIVAGARRRRRRPASSEQLHATTVRSPRCHAQTSVVGARQRRVRAARAARASRRAGR